MNGYCKIMLLLLRDFWYVEASLTEIKPGAWSWDPEDGSKSIQSSITIIWRHMSHHCLSIIRSCSDAIWVCCEPEKRLPAPNAGMPSMQDAIIIYNFPINASFPYQKKHVPVEFTAFQARKWIQALGEMGQQLILQQPKATPWSPSKYPSKYSDPLLLLQGLCLSWLEDIEYSPQASGSGSPPH